MIAMGWLVAGVLMVAVGMLLAFTGLIRRTNQWRRTQIVTGWAMSWFGSAGLLAAAIVGLTSR